MVVSQLMHKKNNYLQTVISSSLQTATANANGDLCIDFCLPTTTEWEYSFVITSSFLTSTLDNLYTGNYDSANQGNPGFVLSTKQYDGLGSYHGKSVKFIGSSGPCPPDPCECWF